MRADSAAFGAAGIVRVLTNRLGGQAPAEIRQITMTALGRRLLGSRLLLVAVSALVLAGPPIAVTATQVGDAWGEPVHEVQLRLGVAKDAPPSLPGELPMLEVRLRNQGSTEVTFNAEAVVLAEIEIDGVWYSQISAGSCCSKAKRIATNAESDPLPVTIVWNALFELNAKPARQADVRAGRHAIRVRSIARSLFAIQRGVDRGIIVVSNTIFVDIPDLSAAQEQRVLSARTAAGGQAGLPAARRLATKYPDAAVAAIARAVEIPTEQWARSEYVRLAGTVPGDQATAFLVSQLAAEGWLLSQVTAADALLSRGRLDWLTPMTEAWRTVQRRLPRRTSEDDATALLIAFLARSGVATAIDVLGDDAKAPADVRLAVVQTFLPAPKDPGGRRQSARAASVALMARNEMATLPVGPAGKAVEQLLGKALDDTGRRVGLQGTYEGTSYVDPRVREMAAFVMSRRWPDRYQFGWPATLAERDAQIAVIRKTWQASRGTQAEAFVPITAVSFRVTTDRETYRVSEAAELRFHIVNVSHATVYVPREFALHRLHRSPTSSG